MIKSSTFVLLHGTWLSLGAGEAAEPRERQSLRAAMYPHSIPMKRDGTSGNPGTGSETHQQLADRKFSFRRNESYLFQWSNWIHTNKYIVPITMRHAASGCVTGSRIRARCMRCSLSVPFSHCSVRKNIECLSYSEFSRQKYSVFHLSQGKGGVGNTQARSWKLQINQPYKLFGIRINECLKTTGETCLIEEKKT